MKNSNFEARFLTIDLT